MPHPQSPPGRREPREWWAQAAPGGWWRAWSKPGAAPPPLGLWPSAAWPSSPLPPDTASAPELQLIKISGRLVYLEPPLPFLICLLLIKPA